MSTALLLSPSTNPKALQTRETFPAVKDSTLGTVQVADELGFAYLDGDIDFGATGKHEIFQNIKYIILTEYFSVPLDREFGMNYSMVDKPMPIAEAILSQEVAMRIALYEPRAQFREIDFVRDELIGKLSPSVKVVILTTDEGPSLYRTITGGAAIIPMVTKATIASGDAFSGQITGLKGEQGPAGTLVIGDTTTGEPGTDALVVNTGTPSSAVLEFTIPEGEKGEPGQGVTIKGTVPTSSALPTTGNTPGDMWITADTGHGWSWDGTKWVDVGPVQGPPGQQGPQGPQGGTGATGQAATVAAGTTTTGAPGTNANVVNSGSSSAAIFNFTIPRGDVGAQGAQGSQGTQGIQGPTGAPGQTWRGTWNAATSYVTNDAVEYQGSTFICTGPNINEPPVPNTGSNWLPPLANTGNRGSIAALPVSNQILYYARGDNTWAILPTYDLTPAVGTIVQSSGFNLPVGGSTGAQATTYGFTSAQGTLFCSGSFTPKYANSLMRVSFSATAQITGTMPGWYGFALFKDSDASALCQAWHYTTVSGAGANLPASRTFVLTAATPITFSFRGGLGQASTVITTPTGGAVFIDEIKQ